MKQALQRAREDLQIAERQSARAQLATDFQDLAQYGPKDAAALQAEMRMLIEQYQELQVR